MPFASSNTEPPTVALLLLGEADPSLALLLEGFGYTVAWPQPGQSQPDPWQGVDVIIADEAAAQQHGAALLARKAADALFLPLLLLLPTGASADFWLGAGFDEVLRAPLSPSELAARLSLCLRLRSLSHSQEQFQQIVTSVSDYIYVAATGPEGTWQKLYASPHVQPLTGYPAHYFVEQPPFWRSLIHPEDRPLSERQRERYARGEDSEVAERDGE